MRSHPQSWTALLAKLGFSRKKRRSQSTPNYGRKLRFEQCEDRRMLAAITVDSPFDVIDANDNVTTLREAIIEANQFSNEDTINFAPGLNGATIMLGRDVNGNQIPTGSLQISESLTIDATALPNGITIDASGTDPKAIPFPAAATARVTSARRRHRSCNSVSSLL